MTEGDLETTQICLPNWAHVQSRPLERFKSSTWVPEGNPNVPPPVSRKEKKKERTHLCVQQWHQQEHEHDQYPKLNANTSRTLEWPVMYGNNILICYNCRHILKIYFTWMKSEKRTLLAVNAKSWWPFPDTPSSTMYALPSGYRSRHSGLTHPFTIYLHSFS